jgi:hypothetical protein
MSPMRGARVCRAVRHFPHPLTYARCPPARWDVGATLTTWRDARKNAQYKNSPTVSPLTPVPLELRDGPLKQAITDLRSPQTSQEMAMLNSIKKTAIQITAIAMLTTAASYALAAPGGYAAPSAEEACVTSPSSLGHAPCTNGGN